MDVKIPRSSSSLALDRKMIDRKELSLAEEIGRGGFGRVHKGAYNSSQGAITVAIKVLSDKNHPDLPTRLRDEAKVMLALKHPNIVKFYGLCFEQVCLVMEYVDNGSLYQLLNDEIRLEYFVWEHRYQIARDIIQALIYLHEPPRNEARKPVIHRDIKSDNVLLTRDFRAKLADFGLAYEVYSSIEEETNAFSKKRAGTINYKAPELLKADGPQYSSSSDIYAFGMVLFEMAMHTRPFPESAPEDIKYAVLIKKTQPNVSDEIIRLQPKYTDAMFKCWEYNPNNRPKIRILESIFNALYQGSQPDHNVFSAQRQSHRPASYAHIYTSSCDDYEDLSRPPQLNRSPIHYNRYEPIENSNPNDFPSQHYSSGLGISTFPPSPRNFSELGGYSPRPVSLHPNSAPVPRVSVTNNRRLDRDSRYESSSNSRSEVYAQAPSVSCDDQDLSQPPQLNMTPIRYKGHRSSSSAGVSASSVSQRSSRNDDDLPIPVSRQNSPSVPHISDVPIPQLDRSFSYSNSSSRSQSYAQFPSFSNDASSDSANTERSFPRNFSNNTPGVHSSYKPLFSVSSEESSSRRYQATSMSDSSPSTSSYQDRAFRRSLSSITSQSSDDSDSLISALSEGNLSKAKKLVERGASLLQPSKRGRYPLVAAIYSTNLSTVKYVFSMLPPQEINNQLHCLKREKAQKYINENYPQQLKLGTFDELREWYSQNAQKSFRYEYDKACLKDTPKCNSWEKYDSNQLKWEARANKMCEISSEYSECVDLWEENSYNPLTYSSSANPNEFVLFIPSVQTHRSVIKKIQKDFVELCAMVELVPPSSFASNHNKSNSFSPPLSPNLSNKVADIFPKEAQQHYDKAIVYHIKWQNENAKTELFQAAVYYDYPPANLLYGLLRQYMDASNASGHEAFYEKVTKQFLWFETDAKTGKPDALFNFGFIYLNGIGVRKDIEKGLFYITDSAKKGYVVAQNWLGMCYETGAQDLPINYDFAFQYYKQAAIAGYADAQFRLGKFYAIGSGCAQNFATAVEYYTKAAEQQHMMALFELGLLCQDQNIDQAMKYFDLSKKLGYKPAEEAEIELSEQLSQQNKKSSQIAASSRQLLASPHTYQAIWRSTPMSKLSGDQVKTAGKIVARGSVKLSYGLVKYGVGMPILYGAIATKYGIEKTAELVTPVVKSPKAMAGIGVTAVAIATVCTCSIM